MIPSNLEFLKSPEGYIEVGREPEYRGVPVPEYAGVGGDIGDFVSSTFSVITASDPSPFTAGWKYDLNDFMIVLEGDLSPLRICFEKRSINRHSGMIKYVQNEGQEAKRAG